MQLEHLKARLKTQNLELVATPAALDKLAEVGYDPVYGARPLKRAIRQNLENPLAEALLTGEFLPGDTIEITVEKGEIVFKKTTS